MALMRIKLSQIKAQDSSLASFNEQVSAMGVPHYQIINASDGQTIFTVSKPYQVGIRQLNVYLNGIKVKATSTPLLSDGDYKETSQTSIEFLYALESGDVVELRMEGKGQGVSMVVDHYHAYQETPIGTVNGTNKAFVLSRSPKANSESVYVNGRIMKRGQGNDYTISTNVITFSEAPASSSVIIVNYDLLYNN